MSTQPVNNPSAVNCAIGGNSVPMLVDVVELPFNDVTVALVATAAGDDGTSVSDGLTPP